MYLQIYSVTAEDYVKYERIRDLVFVPEADLTLSSLPVNQFTVEVMTSDDIAVGAAARLYDDLDALWADYRVAKAERVDRETVRVLAQSQLMLLDRWTCPAKMYINDTVDVVAASLFELPASGHLYPFTIAVDEYYLTHPVSVTGFCPEQTARERLQWLCLTVGAYVRQWAGFGLTIAPVPDLGDATEGTLIPVDKIFWKPSMATKDLTRSVRIEACRNYDTVERPQLDQESATEADGTTWWFNREELEFENEDAPGEPGREVTIDGVTLIHSVYAMSTLTRLALAYFRRREIVADVIDNGEYWPGQRVRVYIDENTVYAGAIRSCAFTFGTQARARLTLSADDMPEEMGRLTILYKNGDAVIGTRTYSFPVDEDYAVDNPVVRRGRLEYIPDGGQVTGTMTGAGRTVEVRYVVDRAASIAVTAPPTKVDYIAGEAIDYAGLEVTAYTELGTPWTGKGRYPGGVIPAEELILPTAAAALGDEAQAVPVQWARPDDGEVLETAFDIEVAQPDLYTDGDGLNLLRMRLSDAAIYMESGQPDQYAIHVDKAHPVGYYEGKPLYMTIRRDDGTWVEEQTWYLTRINAGTSRERVMLTTDAGNTDDLHRGTAGAVTRVLFVYYWSASDEANNILRALWACALGTTINVDATEVFDCAMDRYVDRWGTELPASTTVAGKTIDGIYPVIEEETT